MAKSPKKTFREKLSQEVQSLVIDLFQLFGFIMTLAIGQRLANYFFSDALLFDRFRKSWVFDLGDVVLIICFTVRAAKRLLKD